MNTTLKKMIYLNATDKKNEENFSDYEFRCSDSMIQIDKKFDYYVNKLSELR